MLEKNRLRLSFFGGGDIQPDGLWNGCGVNYMIIFPYDVYNIYVMYKYFIFFVLLSSSPKQ